MMSKKITVAVVYGGKSTEHDVSLQTALSVIQAIDKEKYDIQPVYINKLGDWLQRPQITGEVNDVKMLTATNENSDENTALISPVSRLQNTKQNEGSSLQVVLPLLHGANGEDGTVQGLFELLDVPYVGANVLASSVAMDKVILRDLFQTYGFAQPKYLSFTRHDIKADGLSCYSLVEKQLGFPCFVKPANAGSSVGISKCSSLSELETGIQESLKYDHKVIIEEAIKGREIEIGVIGNYEPIASVAGEIAFESDFYDYETKYHDEKTKLIIPAQIPQEAYEQMKEIALTAYKAINCTGLSRVDFFFTEDNKVLINEINTLPGFTPYSMFPQLWAHSGLSYPKLIDRLIEYAIERYEDKKNITYMKPQND
jgi:D-alanine-D-alanine ligase